MQSSVDLPQASVRRPFPGRLIMVVLLKLLFVALLVTLISRFNVINFASMSRIFAHPAAVAVAAAAVVVTVQVAAVRWYILLRIQGIFVPLWRVWCITYTSYFFGNFTLGTLGVDAMRLYYLRRECRGHIGQPSLSIVLDRLVGLIALLLLAITGFAANANEIAAHPVTVNVALFTIVLMIAICVAIGGMVVFERASGQLTIANQLIQKISIHMSLLVTAYRSSLTLAGVCLLISIIGQLVVIGAIIVCARALNVDNLAITQLGTAALISTIANQIPVTPGGLALGETAFAQVARLMDPANPDVDYGSVVFLFRLISLLAITPGMITFFFTAPRSAERIP